MILCNEVVNREYRIEVSDGAEAGALLKAWGASPAAASSASGGPLPNPRVDKELASLLGLLGKKEGGVTTAQVMKAIGVKSPRAVGRKAFSYRNRLQNIGFEFDRVVTRYREGNSHLWAQGPDFKKALAAIS